MKLSITLPCTLFLAGCQSSDPLSGKTDPKSESWELAFTEPYYMKVEAAISINQQAAVKISCFLWSPMLAEYSVHTSPWLNATSLTSCRLDRLLPESAR